ncbi:ATP-binding cassette domain-containing protein [Salinisphaera sp. SPP-AMP-43]|uniref:ATP-binding cassette domain-containing protein n=1 Tax=Salinisphaera sp. SPP-AMP-43 TaxID=3121288 RepID=UPI003C6E6CF0
MDRRAHTSPQSGIVIAGLGKHFGGHTALTEITTHIAPGRLTGLVGPDGAGKTTLLRILTGLMTPDAGRAIVAGHDVVADNAAIHRVTGYMPQRFGLYEDLSVYENLRLYAELRGLAPTAHDQTFARLLGFTRLEAFTTRLAGKLSGGMKQKLGLACALMARPPVLLLDEPGVGVDPLSRRDLWHMVNELVDDGMTVVWSTAYLDEAERCAHVLLLNEGELAYDGPPGALTARLAGRCFGITGIDRARRGLLTRALDLASVGDGVIEGSALRMVLKEGATTDEIAALVQTAGADLAPVAPRFEDAFVDWLGGGPGGTSALAERMDDVLPAAGAVVACRHLCKHFGAFVAADDVSFEVARGEIFGLLGPNGAGKSTTFKMLCGLLKPSAGQAEVAGHDLRRAAGAAKRQLGYMAQKFSLYGLLSVRQNLTFFAGVYGLDGRPKHERIDEMIEIFQLAPYLNAAPEALPLGFRQRLAMACALMHRPPVLFLDEPTSGVDPITRREFWSHINGLVRHGVTVMVTTHFMDEAEYCDRVALMDRARLIALDTPDALKQAAATADDPTPSMEAAFIRLIEAADRPQTSPAIEPEPT